MAEPARAQGRDAVSTRPISFETGYTRWAEGSVLARCGETVVLCNASVEDRVPPHCEEMGRGWVTAEYALLPRSTHERTRREGRKGPVGGRTLEIQRMIGRSLRAACDLRVLAGFTIRLDCDVLQADGGTRTTAVSGGFVALELAIRGLLEDNLVPGNPVRTPLAAISVGIVDGNVLVDLDYTEDSRAQVDMNLVMDAEGRFIETQATAEGDPFSREHYDQMLDRGSAAIRSILELQRAVLAAG